MIDQVIIAAYLLLMLVIGLIVGRRTSTFSDYAIGKRNLSTLILLTAIFASLVEASETLDLAKEVITDGLAYCLAYLGAAFASLTLAIFVAPKFGPYLGMLSTGDIMEKHFGTWSKTLIGFSTLFQMVLLAGAQILAISQTAEHFFGVSGNLTAIIVSLITLIYCFRGGARSVNATDVIQFGIMIVALPILCGFALIKIGGYSTIFSLIREQGVNFPKQEAASYVKCSAMFIAFALPGLFPLMIQRMLMAKSIIQLRQSLVLHTVLGTIFRIIVITLGVIAFIVLPNVDPAFALSELANFLLPSGLMGLAIIGLLSVLMSTIDSAVHLGAVAFTHDLVGSLSTNKLSDQSKLHLARFASVAFMLLAVLVAIKFDDIGDIFYLLLVIGNSVVWPGLLLIFTRASISKTGFWVGAIAGFLTAILCIYVFDVFMLYSNFVAIVANILAHLIYVAFTDRSQLTININWSSLTTPFQPSRLLGHFQSIRLVKNQDYCNIFLTCSVFLSVYPFFIVGRIDNNFSSYIFLFINALNAVLAFTLLFVELWPKKLARLFPWVWGLAVTLALPAQTFFMLLQNRFSLIWLMDVLVIIPLVATVTTKRAAIVINACGILLSLLASLTIDFSSPPSFINDFGYWALLMHVLVLSLCMALFRKRDVEMCRFASSTLLHETKRALSTFENAACYYERRLPILVSKYKELSGGEKASITSSELDLMLSIPNEIQSLSKRTRSFLTKFFDRIASYSSERPFGEICNVRECISSAISDPSLNHASKNNIHFNAESDLIINGDREQLIQVFVNILENAHHATIAVPEPKIQIEILGQTVFVTDNGEGIREADIPNIFDELFSTKSSSGQGLAFCKRVMLEHGGNIICTSKKGSFTRFELRFPPINERSFTC